MRLESPFSQSPGDLIQAQLEPGEYLRWTGRQNPAHYWTRRALKIGMLGLFTLIACLTAGLMILMNPDFLKKTFGQMTPVLAPLAGAAAGTYLLLHELVNARQGAPALYGITSRRAIVITPGHKIRVWSYRPQELRQWHVRRRRDGSGDIIFESCTGWGTDAAGRARRQRKTSGFFDVTCLDEALHWLERFGKQERSAR